MFIYTPRPTSSTVGLCHIPVPPTSTFFPLPSTFLRYYLRPANTVHRDKSSTTNQAYENQPYCILARQLSLSRMSPSSASGSTPSLHNTTTTPVASSSSSPSSPASTASRTELRHVPQLPTTAHTRPDEPPSPKSKPVALEPPSNHNLTPIASRAETLADLTGPSRNPECVHPDKIRDWRDVRDAFVLVSRSRSRSRSRNRSHSTGLFSFSSLIGEIPIGGRDLETRVDVGHVTNASMRHFSRRLPVLLRTECQTASWRVSIPHHTSSHYTTMG